MARKKGGSSAMVAKPTGQHLQLLGEIWRDKEALQRHLRDHYIDELDDKGETLLHVACADTRDFVGNSDTLVKQLLLAGADFNLASTTEGFTPLMVARTPEAASCLLDNGADIERECNEECTALHSACAGGRLAVAKVLLKRGAEHHILKSSKGGATPLSAAFTADETDIIMLLLQYLFAQADFDINHPTLVLDQPLVCAAAWSGKYKVVEAALDHGAFINAAGPNGTALRLAAHEGHLDIVSLLCERGADVNVRCSSMRMNSIKAALMGGHVRIIKKLIKHGADINAISVDLQLPAVVQAAMLGKCAVLAVLLQAGAHFDAAVQSKCFSCTIWHLADAAAAEVVKVAVPYCSGLNEAVVDNGDSALAYVISIGKLQTARVLHTAGADIHCKVQSGSIAHAAAQSGKVAVVKWVQSLGLDLRGRNVNQELPLHYACCNSTADVAKYLLDLPGAADDVHTLTVNQQTPLCYAAVSGADSVMQLLLQRGAHIDVTDVSDGTPLMTAKTAAAVKLLLAAGADAAVANCHGFTALHMGARTGVTAGVICLLLKAGADPTAVDNNGSTAAHVAGINGHFALEALLSRAADDYRKKQTAAAAAVDSATAYTSVSSSSSGNASVSVATELAVSGDSSSSSSCINASSSQTVATSGNSSASGNSSGSVAVSLANGSAAATISTDGASVHEQRTEASDDALTIQSQHQQQQQSKAYKAKQPCANCSKPTTKRCRRCATVYYCSAECQKACFKDAQHRAQCEAKAAEIA
jgi:uncharacterized protein